MRVLLDESLSRLRARELPGHFVATVRQQGWNGLKNGALLKQARAAEFQALITADQNLQSRQNLSASEIGIIVLVAKTNRLQDLLPLVESLLNALETIRGGQVVRIPRSK